MKQIWKARRALSMTLAVLLALSLATAAFAEDVLPACDETYYATLDYYGALKDSSVVKSYRTNGSAHLTDFGKYDGITNLTDNRTPSAANGKVTFDLSGDIPNKFYFEGKTAQPYQEFPWKLALHYALNGVPTKAEDMAGKSGVAEITLDAVPNPAASAYSRNNLVLTAVSMFNGDDILSLEAPGAQVQLVGNLYCVMYMVLPGEEQHFTIRVGSEDFAYSGMVLLAVPATLQQLEQVADLRDAKETTEDSYHAIDDSMDAILDAMDGMSGHLGAAASGLDQLNQARGSISGGKDRVYSSVDAALAAVEALTKSLEPVTGDLTPEPLPEELEETETVPSETEAVLPAEGDVPSEASDPAEPALPEPAEHPEGQPVDSEADAETNPEANPEDPPAEESEDPPAEEEDIPTAVTEGHLATAQRALIQTTRLLNEMNANVKSLKPELENLRNILRDLQDDLQELRSRLDDAKDSSNDLNQIAGSLTADLDRLGDSLEDLRVALGGTRRISSVPSITVNGMTTSEIRDAADKANNLHGMYEASGFEGSFKDFLVGGAGLDEGQASQVSGIYDQSQAPGFSEKLDQADTANSMISGVNSKINEINRMVDSLSKPAADVVGDLEDLTGDLSRLSRLVEDLTEDTDDYTYDTLDTLDDAIDLAVRVSGNVDTAIDQLDSLNGLVNTYEPEIQQALTDTYQFATSASLSLSALAGAAKSMEDLLQTTGPSLDSGTRQTLSSVASALRKSTSGLDQTDTIRSALDTINELVTDQWNSHTGEDNNVLLMDAQAQPESMTDSRNTNVTSIQYVIRTQEIKVDEAAEAEAEKAAEAEKGSLWTRIKKMFSDIWAAITGIF